MAYQQDYQNQQSAPYGHHYRTYSSTYYNADHHDQGPVSPVVTSQPDHFSTSHLSAAHRSSLVSPIGTDYPHHGYAAGLDGRDSNSPAPEVSPIMSRSGSVASDQFSNVSGLTAATATIPSTPQNVRPAPAYIAPFGAVQVISEHQAAQRSDEEDETKDDIKISDSGLILVNSFLDQLLYSILSHARSTNLSQLKPAIVDVLRQRLGRAAIASADEELRELLAENDEEEESNTQHNSGERNAQWDLELVWKRTRLRVMVYMRLGELEDEDEDRYIKEEELLHGSERRFSQSTGLVSWAAAIFLTSILEFIAEQTLQVAGRATFTRVRRSSRVERGGGLLTNALVVHDPIVVEEHDVEKVALDSVLGRSWRTWRKAMRNSAGAASYVERPSASRDSEDVVSRQSSFKSALNYVLPRRNSLLAGPSQAIDFEPELDHPEYILASNIPLPLSTRDVDEIEVPGLAKDPDAEDLPPPIPLKSSRRRRTLTDMPPLELMGDLPAPVIENHPVATPTSPSKPPLVRRRSASAPTPAAALIPIADMPTRDTPTGETSADNLPTEDLPAGDLPAGDLPAEDLPAEDLPAKDLPAEELPTEEMPGAFPVEGQGQVEIGPESRNKDSDALPTIIADTEEQPEPKANAAEMAQYKRLSQMPTELKGEVQPDPQEKMTTATAESEPTQPDPENNHPVASEEAEKQTLIGAAIAGASAVVAATATAMSTALSSTEPRDDEELDNAQGSADAKNEDPPVEQKSPPDVEAAADVAESSTQPPSLAGSSSPAASRKVSPNRAGTPPPGVNKRQTSPDSYTLGGEETAVNPVPNGQPKKRLSMSGNMLSASARVRDSLGAGRMSLDRTPSSSPAISDAEQQARGASRRSSRLYLGSMLEDTPSKEDLTLSESPTQSTSPTYLSDESAEQPPTNPSLNGTGEHMDVSKPLQSVEEARSSLTRPPGRRSSVPGSALTSSLNTISVPEKSSRRQSRNAALDKLEGRVNTEDEATSNPTGSSSLASFGFDAPRSRLAIGAMVDGRYATGQGVNGVSTTRSDNAGSVVPIEMVGLTSASIRGPEDFDLFAANDEAGYVHGLDSVGESEDTVQSPPRYHDSSSREPASSARVDSQQPTGHSSLPPASRQTHEDTRAGRSQTSKHVTSAGESRVNQTSLKDKRRSVSRPPQRNTSVHKSGLMAREPRVMTESTRDFADFIRSTGPRKEPVVVPLLSPANRSTISLHSLRSAHINGSRASLVERTKSLTKSTMDAHNIPPVPVIPPTTSASTRTFRSSMQPRGATTQNAGNSEFIDFIRSGPAEPGNHRISRTVAPFRSTMDSDQLNDMGNRINGTGHLDLTLNTNVGGPAMSDRYPIISPISSDPSPQLVHPAHSGGPSRLSGAFHDLNSPMDGGPVKKRFREKDPYAAYNPDLADEDDDLLTALPNGDSNPRQEESLVDFLKSSSMAASTKDFIAGSSAAGDAAHLPVHPPSRNGTGAYTSETGELADFLRSSGPVEESRGAPAPIVSNQRRQSVNEGKAGQKKGGLLGVLTRARTNRSSAGKNTYLDLR